VVSSPLNVGIRHILPVVPFLLALAAIGAVTLIKKGRGFAYAVGGLLIWNVISCLHAFPNYMPYSNELWGGPSQTHRYLSDAAVEWGQNLKWTKEYLDRHNIHDCYFAYFVEPYILPSDYGIPCKLLPTLESKGQVDLDVPDVIHGTVLISDSVLSGYELGSRLRNPYDSLFQRTPDDVIMNGVEVYHGDFHLPLASSMMYEIHARRLLAKDPAAALVPAQRAVQIAPDGIDANVILGNVYLALGQKQNAAQQYRKALAIADRMEPSARVNWRDRINLLLAKCNQIAR
jgi:tetratricopeptide (TPR) repeat protein